jgi:cellulose synthase/poly-beta-1,6-N-acetylglucosamine synthase-like glycosyltransferase
MYDFPEKKEMVTVILGLKHKSISLKQNLERICNQRYPSFELLMVLERKEDSAYAIARQIENSYAHARILISGLHDPAQTVGKNHNLVYGASQAKGNILLFADSDISFPKNWINRLVDPLGNIVRGNIIHAVTIPSVIRAKGLVSRFPLIVCNYANYLIAYLKKNQDFKTYCLGTSIAVNKRLFYELKVDRYWSTEFNDDVLFSHVLTKNGKNIYFQRNTQLRPEEDFNSTKDWIRRIIRWSIITVPYQHSEVKWNTIGNILLTSQSLLGMLVSVILLCLGLSVYWFIGLFVFAYSYGVITRWIIGKRMGEEYGWVYLLFPLILLFHTIFGLVIVFFFKSFRWGEHKYRLPKKFHIKPKKEQKNT